MIDGEGPAVTAARLYPRKHPRADALSNDEDVMDLLRRKFLQLATGAATLPAISRIAMAQAYPSRPVRLIVGAAGGSSPDIFARLLGQDLAERLGQPFVIENRPGSGGNIATAAVVRAPADGYTLLLVSTTNTISATLYDDLKFDFIRDIAPVSTIARAPLVMLVHPSVPAKTVPEFIAYAKANPGKISMASAGNGTSVHMSGELFKMLAGVDMVHVPYRSGAPAQTDLIAGHVQVMFISPAGLIEYIQAGKLRALAVTTAMRSDALPDLPTVGDFVPGYESSTWWGIGAPRNTPVEIVGKLNKDINAALADPKIQARLADLGSNVFAGSSADFEKLIAGDTEKWAKVVKASGARPD
jgi:tripartite-type tricarboxylate transporter receptor subunit TctC